MREIKFRAWDEKNETMHNDFQFVRSGAENNDWILFVSDKQPMSDYGKWTKNPFAVQQLKIMQYTGLKDCNGKEIYEGDILNSLYRQDGCKGLYIIAPHPSDKTLYPQRAGNHQQRFVEVRMFDMPSCEIVGNIYETPEVLEDLEAKNDK